MRIQTLNSSRMHDGISKAHIERFSEFHVLSSLNGAIGTQGAWIGC